MPRSCHTDRYVILLDESAATKVHLPPLSWANYLEGVYWCPDAMGPCVFPQRFIPMKRASGAHLVGYDAPASKST